MKCSGLTAYRNSCKNKDVCENGLCKMHSIMETNAEPIEEGGCIFIHKNYKRCNMFAYIEGDDKNYCPRHSLYVLSMKVKGVSGCKCCIDLYIHGQEEKLMKSYFGSS
jgi:hypothetical protein